MKTWLKKVFLVIMIFVFIVIGAEIFSEFMNNHTYYYEMFKSWENWKIVLSAILSAAIPGIYLLRNKEFSLKKFIIYLLVGLLIFSLLHLIIKGWLVGSGFIIYSISNILLFILWAYFLVWTLALGTTLSKLIIKFKENRIQELFLNFGLWLGAILILTQILMWFGVFHPAIVWIVFLGLAALIYIKRSDLGEYSKILSQTLSGFKISELKQNWWKYLLFVLVIFSIIYYFYGFQLSFIPYSTAWDANHEYLYIPKVVAENFGLIWWNVWAAGSMPFLRHSFIAFWFSLWSVFNGSWLSPDTIAVSMNFLSGPLVLFFGLALIHEAIEFFSEKLKLSNMTKSLSFATGWMTLLLWLTSGMWAFLVFVDNKTDLWVMALTILAILSGFIFIRYISQHKWKSLINKESLKYLILSGFMFALASMAKPTAFIDIAVFAVLLLALWINSIMGLGLWVIALGFMGILQPANAPDFMWPALWKLLAIIGLIIVIIWVIQIFVKNKKTELKDKKSLFYYIVIWGIATVASLLIFKWPWLLYKQVINKDFSISNFAQGLLISKDQNIDNKVLLADIENIDDLKRQNTIDEEYLSESQKNLSIEECLLTEFTPEELEEWKKEAVVGNEDVGRYVWYGWKEFNHPKRLSYNLLRIIYPKNKTCYGLNSDAKLLCRNKDYILAENLDKIEGLANELKIDWKAFALVETLLNDYKENPDTLRTNIVNLKQYYEDHSVYTEKWKIFMPYRYIVPLNITFNWSLQNLSSYYTDIGFIWMFIFAFTAFGLIYSIIKKDQKLFSLSIATVAGWAIWWVIGGAILWYGIGLIMRTILVFAMFIQDLISESENGSHRLLSFTTLLLLWIWMVVQMFFNLIRISSQWASGPFLWFKQSVWTVNEISSQLMVTEKQKIWYSQKDVFDLQFPHYNKFIEYTKDRADQDGVLIAGTYLQYFLHNQKNIRLDGMLSWFWELWSDGDACKTYHRIKSENLKYLVIDPNIATVVMWEWNESLFHRFFAKMDWNNQKVVEKGSMMMLAQLVDEGYAKLFYSNNLWAKYAFELSNDELSEIFSTNSVEELQLYRAQLASARFMTNADSLVNMIAQILSTRVSNGKAIGDIADVFGKTIDEAKIVNTMNVFMSNPNNVAVMVETLNQDERFVLIQYINLFNALQQNNSQQYSEMINNIMMTSLAGGSQLIIFELR